MAEIPVNEATKYVQKQAVPAALHKSGYYGLPMLKRPLWGWEVALYFWAEGVSSGCFVLAAMADLLGAGRFAKLIRTGRYLAFAALLPCPPLLIADLGRPERFHHMLRVVKPSSPMNIGAWALTAYSQPVILIALAHFASLDWMPMRTLTVAGLPFAFFLVAYPGVLLSTTSIPVWAHTRFMGPLLGASSMAGAVSALALATAFDPQVDEETRGAVRNIEIASHIAEAVAIAAYMGTAGAAARPLTKGRYSRMFHYGAIAAGIACPLLLSMFRKKHHRATSAVAGVLGLAGSLALKWAIVHAGKESAEDPAINREVTRGDSANPGWKPTSTLHTGPGYASRME